MRPIVSAAKPAHNSAHHVHKKSVMSDETTKIIIRGGKTRMYRRKFSLEVIAGPDLSKTLITGKESATVGSARWNDLVLSGDGVSRHHLRIRISRDGFLFTDLDSTNGTFVDNLQLQQAVVRGPVDLRVGENMLRFRPLIEEEEVPLLAEDRFGALIGRSAPMRELFQKLALIARQDTTVLIEGETGTGKELIAQEIHRHSPRQKGPFVVVDCGSIPASLVEAELFGQIAGAFTGATENRAGPFEEAERGTVFLDEIGELPQELQPKLLRILERKEVKRVGESHFRTVDVRIVAASNRDLARAVNQGTFRADLYYRLAVAAVSIPPLRQRTEDLDALIAALWPDISRGASDAPLIPAETMTQLKAHLWPGNVRELRNVLERMSVFSNGAPTFEAPKEGLIDEGNDLSLETLDTLPFRRARAHFERRYLTRLLTRCHDNVAEASRQSGIDRVHLYRLIKKYDLRQKPKEPA